MNKKVVPLLSIFFSSVIGVTVLFISSKKSDSISNDFNRHFALEPLGNLNILDLRYNSYYIAGITSNHIYLGNVTASMHLLEADLLTMDTTHLRLNIKDFEKHKIRSLKLKVDPPYFYFMDGVMPGIFRGNLTDGQAKRYMYDSVFFTDSAPISPASFALRMVSSGSNQYSLAKITAESPKFRVFPNVLEKQVDGLFCTDGMMHYNKQLAWLVYLYYYRNQFICMDSSLNLLYRGNTIDTVSQAQIKVAEIKSDKSITMAAPPFIVNKHSAVYADWLFIHSNLLAQNEDKKVFDQSSVIDVYHLKTGEYQFSFYLPDYKGKKIKSFQVTDGKLVALSDHYLLIYPFHPEDYNIIPPTDLLDADLTKVQDTVDKLGR